MSVFNDIKDKVSMVHVLSKVANVLKFERNKLNEGEYCRTTCPLCHSPRDKFVVALKKNIFYCFDCEAMGDPVAFVAQYKKFSPHEAAVYLNETFNLALEEKLAQLKSPEQPFAQPLEQAALEEQLANELRAVIKPINEKYKDFYHITLITLVDMKEMSCNKCTDGEIKCQCRRAVFSYEKRYKDDK
jgi:DNA primase